MPDLFTRQYTIIADTDHREVGHLRVFRDYLRAFAKEGGKVVVMEELPDVQALYERYKTGTPQLLIEQGLNKQTKGFYTKEENVEARRILMDIFKTMRENDMEFIAQDTPTVAKKEFRDADKFYRAWAGKSGAEAKAFEEAELTKNPRLKSMMEEWDKDFDAQRDKADAVVAKHLLKATKNGAKAIIFYGAAHDNEPNRLGVLLGLDKVTTIPVITENVWQTYQQSVDIDESKNGLDYIVHMVKREQLIVPKLDAIRQCIADIEQSPLPRPETAERDCFVKGSYIEKDARMNRMAFPVEDGLEPVKPLNSPSGSGTKVTKPLLR